MADTEGRDQGRGDNEEEEEEVDDTVSAISYE
jgi:hypothetical protein